MGRDGIEPSTSGLKVMHLAPCDAEAHYDTPRNTLNLVSLLYIQACDGLRAGEPPGVSHCTEFAPNDQRISALFCIWSDCSVQFRARAQDCGGLTNSPGAPSWLCSLINRSRVATQWWPQASTTRSRPRASNRSQASATFSREVRSCAPPQVELHRRAQRSPSNRFVRPAR